MKKRKVLFVTEAHFHPTGYSMYTKEVLSRLHECPELEVAELACFTGPEAPEIASCPWKFYPNIPPVNNHSAMNTYNSSINNKFGEFSFHSALLDFKPDFVMDIRDVWMMAYELTSPFRDFYKLAWMPTVDAAPQHPSWIDSFCETDAIFTYSEFGRDTILKQCPNLKEIFKGVASPCASDTFFRIEDKKSIRREFGLSEDAVIFGTVMRNQRRKLYPDLFKAFRLFLDQYQRKNVYLYCHTGYPDVGWEIPDLLSEYNLGTKVYFTYQCKNCKRIEASHFNDALKFCKRCNAFSSALVGVNNKMDESKLNVVYNLMDVYIQWANCSPPGEKIWCNDKWANIEDVKIGDKVITHTGKTQLVTNTFNNNVKEDLLEISVYGDYRKVRITADHPLYAIANPLNDKKSLREQMGQNIRKNNGSFVQPKFIPAGDLAVGDLLPVPIDKTEEEATISFDGNSYEVDNDLAKWVGLYVADGSSNLASNTGTVVVTCHAENDQLNIKLCEKVMTRFGNVGKYDYKNRNATTKRVCNKPFARHMRETCGKLETKRFPNWIYKLPIEKQKLALQGLCMGDGHYDPKSNVTILCTISEELANQVKHLCKRIGFVYNVGKVIKKGNRKSQYRFEMPGNIKAGEFNVKRSSSRSFVYGEYYYSQIKSIENIPYSGPVYTLEVENDHSYVGAFHILKNCEGWGMCQIEATRAGLPLVAVNYSAMESAVKAVEGIPINPIAHYKELETGCMRAVPDNKALTGVMNTLMDNDYRKEVADKCYRNSHSRYNWDDTANLWKDYFLSAEIPDQSLTWDSPPRIFQPAMRLPDDADKVGAVDIANWLFIYVLGKPEWINGAMWRKMVKDLTYRATVTSTLPGYYFNDHSHPDLERKYEEFNAQKAFDICLYTRKVWNQLEGYRNKQ